LKIKTIIILLFLATSAMSQDVESFERRLYHSYVSGAMKDWKSIISDMTVSYQKGKNPELLYSLCFAQYGYIGYCISKELDDEAKNSLSVALANTKELELLYHGRHDVLALRGAFYGFKIMLSKFSAMYLAPTAFKLINEASQSSDTYFNCSLEIGNIRYFTPKFLGGSKVEAIGYYKNAVRLIEASPHKEQHHWIYINTILFLANTYFETGFKYFACRLYEQILEYEPGVNWIRDEYLLKCK